MVRIFFEESRCRAVRILAITLNPVKKLLETLLDSTTRVVHPNIKNVAYIVWLTSKALIRNAKI